MDNGVEITNQEQILKECKNFYERLYKNDETVCSEKFSFFHENCNIPKLDEAENSSCERDLTLTELHETLKSFNKNKSPGIDGLTAELYLKFWDILGPLLLDVYKESFEKGILPENMRVGLITLLEKKV